MWWYIYDRLVKVVMQLLLEALEIGSKVKWVKDLQQSLEKLGWRGLNVVTLDGLTIKEDAPIPPQT